MKVMRKIIEIDEEKCDGCGNCVPACAEGAIQIDSPRDGGVRCDLFFPRTAMEGRAERDPRSAKAPRGSGRATTSSMTPVPGSAPWYSA